MRAGYHPLHHSTANPSISVTACCATSSATTRITVIPIIVAVAVAYPSPSDRHPSLQLHDPPHPASGEGFNDDIHRTAVSAMIVTNPNRTMSQLITSPRLFLRRATPRASPGDGVVSLAMGLVVDDSVPKWVPDCGPD